MLLLLLIQFYACGFSQIPSCVSESGRLFSERSSRVIQRLYTCTPRALLITSTSSSTTSSTSFPSLPTSLNHLTNSTPHLLSKTVNQEVRFACHHIVSCHRISKASVHHYKLSSKWYPTPLVLQQNAAQEDLFVNMHGKPIPTYPCYQVVLIYFLRPCSLRNLNAYEFSASVYFSGC